MDVTRKQFEELRSLGYHGQELYEILVDLFYNIVSMDEIRNAHKKKQKARSRMEMYKIRRAFRGARYKI